MTTQIRDLLEDIKQAEAESNAIGEKLTVLRRKRKDMCKVETGVMEYVVRRYLPEVIATVNKYGLLVSDVNSGQVDNGYSDFRLTTFSMVDGKKEAAISMVIQDGEFNFRVSKCSNKKLLWVLIEYLRNDLDRLVDEHRGEYKDDE